MSLTQDSSHNQYRTCKKPVCSDQACILLAPEYSTCHDDSETIAASDGRSYAIALIKPADLIAARIASTFSSTQLRPAFSTSYGFSGAS